MIKFEFKMLVTLQVTNLLLTFKFEILYLITVQEIHFFALMKMSSDLLN